MIFSTFLILNNYYFCEFAIDIFLNNLYDNVQTSFEQKNKFGANDAHLEVRTLLEVTT